MKTNEPTTPTDPIETIQRLIDATSVVGGHADRLRRQLEYSDKAMRLAFAALVEIVPLVHSDYDHRAAQILFDLAASVKLLTDIQRRLEQSHV